MSGVSIGLTGSFTVRHGSGAPVGSRKALRLLARLAAAQPHVVGVDAIVADLWPDAAPRRPADNVATLVSRMRAVLGPQVLLGGRDGYRLAGPPVALVDVHRAAALAAEAARRLETGDPVLAAAAARRGIEDLGDGSVLVGEAPADWIDALQEDVSTVLRELRHRLADAALAVGDPRTAVGAARAAARDDPLDDHAHRLLMAAHHAGGEPALALAVYEQLRHALAAELGTDPAPATRALHLAVLRGDTAERATPNRPRRPAPPGRDVEMSALSSAWSDAVTGRPGLVLLAGEAGIGKTTLADALADVAADTGGTVAAARCHPAERSLLLQPVLDALAPVVAALAPAELRRLAGHSAAVLSGLLPGTADVLGPPDGERGSADLERRRVFDAVGGLLRALASTGPVLLLLDDLQNAGAATVELMHYLAVRPDGARMLLVATVRSEEGADALDVLSDVGTVVDVGPLTPDTVALLAARAGAPQLAEDILRRTRGHTLFVVETLRGIAAGGSGVPDSLQSAVLARVRRAGAEVERMLRAAAVLGATVTPDDVAALAGLRVADVVHRCVQAAEARLLTEAGDRYAFANDLVQEVLYASTPAPLRDAYHRRAADLHADRPEVAAGHAAAVADWPRAARCWMTAGDAAADRYATADARALLDRALDAVERLDDLSGDLALTGRVRLARARVAEMRGDFAGAVEDLRAALAAARTAGDRHLEMTTLRRYAGDVLSALGLPERERHLDAALRIAEELDDPAARADLLGWQAVVAANRLRFTDAIALGRRAVTAGRAAGDDHALAAGLDGLKTAHAYLGDGDGLRPVLAELEPLLRRGGDLLMLRWAVFESALPAVAAADWDGAAARIDHALALCRRAGQPSHEPWFVAHQGWVERLRGHYDEAVAFGERAVELSRSAAHPWWRTTAVSLLATTLLELGGTAEAARLLAEVRAVTEQGGTEAYLLRCLAPLARATGDPDVLDRADALLARVVTPAGCAWLAGGDTYLAVAEARLAAGDAARARAVLRPLLGAADRHDWIPWQVLGGLMDSRALAAKGEPAASRTSARATGLALRHGMAHLVEGQNSSASAAAARAAPPGSTGR